jgi:hypothetical protein
MQIILCASIVSYGAPKGEATRVGSIYYKLQDEDDEMLLYMWMEIMCVLRCRWSVDGIDDEFELEYKRY